MEKELSEVFFTEKQITLQGQEYVIKPMSWYSEISAAATLSSVLMELHKIWKTLDGKETSLPLFLVEFAECKLEEHAGKIIKALHIATKLEEDLIENLNIEELTDLIICVYELNKTFFVRSWAKIKPRVRSEQNEELQAED